MTDPQLTDLLAEGRTFLWALRQGLPEADGTALAQAGIDSRMLAALREIDHSIARAPHPTVTRARHDYLELQLPSGATTRISPMITEAGLEMGTELFAERTDWTFAHHELQYCTGGSTPIDVVLPHGGTEQLVLRTGDVMLIPEGATLTYHSTEADGRFGHAHIYAMNLEARTRTFYDALMTTDLRGRGLLDGDGEMTQRIDARIEVLDWSQLVSPRSERSYQDPTWMRNGWEGREVARALDHAEGVKRLVITSPDREPEDYLPWGVGPRACRVNPVLCEATAAVTDCVIPQGWFDCFAWSELWTTLRGTARLTGTLAPLHTTEVEWLLGDSVGAVIPAGARVTAVEASDDLVIRRLASSCGQNGHWAMMEAKLRTS